jgi:hypothetical protein
MSMRLLVSRDRWKREREGEKKKERVNNNAMINPSLLLALVGELKFRETEFSCELAFPSLA